MSLTCTRCGTTISADDEDDLVTRVQSHVGEHSRAHGRPHTISREQVLARLHRRTRHDRANTAGGSQPATEPPRPPAAAAEADHDGNATDTASRRP